MVRRVVTTVIAVDRDFPRKEDIRIAAEVIRRGGLVAFPTETVYGLGANAFDANAVRLIFDVKGRPPDNPLIVHVASPAQLSQITSAPIPTRVRGLAARFWPGPLTLVIPRSPNVPEVVAAGLDTVAVRMPDNGIALALIEETGVPVAAPSANLSGRPSPTRAEHVLDDFAGLVELVLDGGPCDIGIESTVLDVSGDPPVVLRPGGVSLEELRTVLPDIKVLQDTTERLRSGPIPSPGVRHLHYRPRAPLILVEPGPEGGDEEGGCAREALRIANELAERGGKVGILAARESAALYERIPNAVVRVLGSRKELDSLGAGLYDELRRFDKLGVSVVVAEGYPERGMGLALMNRLRRAASRIVKGGGENA